MFGFDRYHTYRSSKSPAGFPDEVLWRDRVLFVELKTEKGKPSARQCEILTGLAAAGAECYLWRPSDLDEVAVVLAKRWAFMPPVVLATLMLPRLALVTHQASGTKHHDVWTPRSLWLPNGYRNDEQTQLEVTAA